MDNCKYVRSKEKTLSSFEREKIKKSQRNTYEKKNLGKYERKAEKHNTLKSRFEKSTYFVDNKIKKGFLTPTLSFLMFLYMLVLPIFEYLVSLNMICQVLFGVIVVFTFMNIINTRAALDIKITDFLMLLFLAYSALSMMWSQDDTDLVSAQFRLVLLVVLYFLFRFNITTLKDIRKFLYAFIAGTILMCINITIAYTPAGIINALATGARLGSKVNQLNGIGIYCSMTTVLILYFAFYEKKFKMLALLPVVFIFQMACGSRKGILMLVTGVLLIFFFLAENKKSIMILISFLIFISLYLFFINYSGDNLFLARLSKLVNGFFNDKDTVDNSVYLRMNMYTLGLKMFTEAPVLGQGTNAFPYRYSIEYGVRRVPHSTYMQVLTAYGALGFLMFYGMYVYICTKLISAIRRKIKYASLLFVMIIMLLVNDIGANMLTGKLVYIFLGLTASYISIVSKNEEDNEIEVHSKRTFKLSKFEK